MKNKNIFFLILFVIMSSSIFGALTVTLTTPATSGTVSGNYILNGTVTGHNTTLDLINCSYYVYSSITANTSSTIVIASVTNINTSTTDLNTTLNSSTLEDGNDYSFKIDCWNSTSSSVNGTDTNTDIVIDNTVPVAASSPSPSSGTTDKDGSVAFSVTVTDARTTSCVLYFDGIHPGSSSYTMTYSGSTCSKTITGIASQQYRWYVTSSDGTNTTTSSTWNIGIDTNKGGGVSTYTVTPKTPSLSILDISDSTSNSNLSISRILFFGFVGFVVGSIIPGIGNIVGLIAGLIIGSLI